MEAKLWNVLIHMAADNNLKEECIYELNEILRLGDLSSFDVIAQFDSGSAVTRYDFRVAPPIAENSHPLSASELIAPPDLPPSSTERDLDDIAHVVLAEREILQRIPDSAIIHDFLRAFARRDSFNFISLSGHGSGAVGEFLPSDNPPSALSIRALKSNVIELVARQCQGGRIDILGLDSCLMSMVETCYELQPHVGILIGAEGFEQNAGWPYHEILNELRKNPEQSPKDLAKLVVREYIRAYAPYYASGISVDLSACDLKEEKLSLLTVTLGNLVRLLREQLPVPQFASAVVLAHWQAQSYKFEQYTDLWDFCSLLKGSLERGIFNVPDERIEARRKIEDACRDVMDAIEGLVIATDYHGAAFQHSHGLAVYFPWSKSELARTILSYSELAFAAETGWDKFLIDYVTLSQREVRDDEEQARKAIRPLGMSPKGRIPVVLPGDASHRVSPAIDTRVSPPLDTRVSPPIDTRVSPPLDTRVSPAIDTRVSPPIDTRGKLTFSPEVKNPPTEFYKSKQSVKDPYQS
ncbi:MAG: clostripain-related cysteine peptidase [Blastocatellia bacterium]|nr:clostripain-related cysteine peptidase [Blastocatellia bacterium]